MNKKELKKILQDFLKLKINKVTIKKDISLNGRWLTTTIELDTPMKSLLDDKYKKLAK